MTTPSPQNAPVGTEIVCVNDAPFLGLGQLLTHGAIYTIVSWQPGVRVDTMELSAGVTLGEVRLPAHDCFAPERFRLLQLAGLDSLLRTPARLPEKVS